MAIRNIQSSPALAQAPQKAAVKKQAAPLEGVKSQGLAQDLHKGQSIQKGVVPTLKGAAAGAGAMLGAGALGIGSLVAISKSAGLENLASGLTKMGAEMALEGGIAAAVGGGVAANLTTDKTKGAFIGAAAGAAAGAAMGLITEGADAFSVTMKAISGGIAGAGGGFVGASVAKQD